MTKSVLALSPSAHWQYHYVNDRPTWRLRDLRRRFDRAAASFDSADFVHTVTRDGMFARLLPLIVDAQCILDLGAATGRATPQLRKRYGGAQIVSLDISHSMLVAARRRRSRFTLARPACVQANAADLPFHDASVDLVFSNLMLPFVDRPERVFAEVARVLREGGVFGFATLGPDSLREINRAWGDIDDHAHVGRFLDMHDIGDALIRSGLRDPVIDVDRLCLRYDSPRKLFTDLTDVGARNALTQRNPSLTGKGHFEKMLAALTGENGARKIEIELELVYGHCWGSAARAEPGSFAFDASNIPRRRR